MTKKQSAIRDALIARYGSGRGKGSSRFIDCPGCNKPAASEKCSVSFDILSWHCFLCGNSGNAYDLVRDIVKFDDGFSPDELTPAERAIWSYRKQTGKNHRLSDAVVSRFGIHYGDAGKWPALVWPGPDGIPARWLATGRKRNGWNNVPGVGRVAIGSDKVAPSGLLLFTEGEWDLAAAWEHWKLAGVYIAGGAGAVGKWQDTGALLGFVNSGHDVVIFYDTDQAGAAGAHNLATNIWTRHKCASIKIVDWTLLRQSVPGVERAKAGADLEDAIRAGLTLDLFLAILDKIPAFRGAEAPAVLPAADSALIATDDPPPPPMPRELSRLEPILPDIWSARRLPKFERERYFYRVFRENPDTVAQIIGATSPDFDPVAAIKWLDDVLVGPVLGSAVKFAAAEAVRRDAIHRERGRGRMGAGIIWKFNGSHFEEADADDVSAATESILEYVGGYMDGSHRRAALRREIRAELTAAVSGAPEAEILSRIDRRFLCLADGVLDMETLTIHPHGPQFKFRAVNADVTWATHGNGCDAVHQFLDRTLGAEQTREFWKFLYTTIAVFPRIQKAAFFCGHGGSGKGTAAQLFKLVVGEAYTSALTVDDLEDDFKAFSLVGKVLNIWEELANGGHLNAAKFKMITGSSQMTANGKFRDPFTFISEAQWLITTNAPPNPSDYSEAFLRRLVLFQFASFNPAERSASYFEDVLKPQAAGVLHYALTKGREWYAADSRQFGMGETAKDTLQFIMDSDSVAGFWDDRIKNPVGDGTLATLGETWVDWWQRGRPAGGFDSIYNLDITEPYKAFVERVLADGQKQVSKQVFLARTKDFFYRHIGEQIFKGERWVKFDVWPKEFETKKTGKTTRGVRLGYQSPTTLADLVAGCKVAPPEDIPF